MSERRFNVGDRVRVILRSSCFYGQETTVTAVGSLAFCYETSRYFDGYQTGIPHVSTAGGIETQYAIFKAESIKLIYDGNEKVSWSECEWRPAGVHS